MVFHKKSWCFLLLPVFDPRYSCPTERAWQVPIKHRGKPWMPQPWISQILHLYLSSLYLLELKALLQSWMAFSGVHWRFKAFVWFMFYEMELQLKSTCDIGHLSLQIQTNTGKQLYTFWSKLMPPRDSEAGWFIAAENPHASGNNIKLSLFILMILIVLIFLFLLAKLMMLKLPGCGGWESRSFWGTVLRDQWWQTAC